MIKTLMLVFTLMFLCTIILRAQEPAANQQPSTTPEQEQRMTRRRPGSLRNGPRNRDERKGLLGDLTDAQRELASIRTQRDQLFELRQRSRAGSLTEEDRSRARAIRQELRKTAQTMRTEMRSSLTNEQRLRFDELREERHRRREEMLRKRQELRRN